MSEPPVDSTLLSAYAALLGCIESWIWLKPTVEPSHLKSQEHSEKVGVSVLQQDVKFAASSHPHPIMPLSKFSMNLSLTGARAHFLSFLLLSSLFLVSLSASFCVSLSVSPPLPTLPPFVCVCHVWVRNHSQMLFLRYHPLFSLKQDLSLAWNSDSRNLPVSTTPALGPQVYAFTLALFLAVYHINQKSLSSLHYLNWARQRQARSELH